MVAPRTLLPRLLVWTGLVLLQRDETDRAKAYIDEAWELAQGESALSGVDAHNVIPAHMGMAGYALARGEFRAAIRWGQKGLAIAERFGYVVWSIHRLLPIVGEAALYVGDYELAAEVAAQLRELSTFLGHRLGLALANALDALVLRMRDNDPRAARLILEAAVDLESVPYVFHAARLRRNAAQLLAADGLRDEAVRELRRSHDVFAQLGAELELRSTREELRALGARPPQRTRVAGGGLTGRELEIARLVARRRTNKEIARALGISARTVSTHLSNIFQKLEVDSRGALADAVREMGDDGPE